MIASTIEHIDKPQAGDDKRAVKLLSIIIANTLSELEEKYAYLVERLALKRSQSAYAYAYAN